MILSPAADAVAKTLATGVPPMTVVCLRYLAAGVVALAIAAALRRPVSVPRRDLAGQVFRTALLMAAMSALVAALGLVPLAKAAGGFLIAPVVSVLLGILLWGEAPTPQRLAGAALSCAGATLLLRPEADAGAGSLYALLGGALLGAYLAAQRGAGTVTDALSTLAVQSLLGAALLAPFALARGLPAATPGLAGGVLALGALSAACHGLTVAAYRRAEATALAPFLYFNLAAALAAGWLWFGETLSPAALGGLAAIVAGGLVTLLPGRFRLPFRHAIG
jgi:drug/metabolite transporter (DMT)-like permease